MLFLRFLLIAVGVGLFGAASGVVAYDIYIAAQLRRLLGCRKLRDGGTEAGEKPLRPLSPVRGRLVRQLSRLGIAPFLLGSSVVAASGALAGARVSRTSRTLPATLDSGARLVVPLTDNAVIYDLCEHALSARTRTEEIGKALASRAAQQRLGRRS